MASTADIQAEQAYFDLAAQARERSRQTLTNAPSAAAGSRAAVSAVKKGADAQLTRMSSPDEAVAFAMFVDDEGERYYLGKHAISDDDRNKLVINWQAPAATPYFEANFEDPCGVVSRRKFSTKKNRVLDFDEVLFAELAASVGELTQADMHGIDDAVLRDLDQTRDGEMRDIVQTIHAAQYELIRADLDQLLVVQGGPGTGKTAVALHRVSWLLWNYANQLKPTDVLVVGPNATFTKYIRKVLPGLGDDDVQHVDIRSMGPMASSSRSEPLDVLRLKGEARMADLLARALRHRVRVAVGVEQLEVGPPGRMTRIDRADVERTIKRLLSNNTTFNAGRTGFRSWLADQASSDVSPAQIEAAAERVWPNLSPQQFLQDLFASRERLIAAAGDDFTAGDIQRLVRSAAARVSEESWSDADVALLDEVQQLMSGRPQSYGHVVLDEAQDLSPMQLRSIRRRSRSGSMTVVGDIAQSTGPWARDSWDDVVHALQQDLPASREDLTLGYRVPQQIYALAAELLPHAAPGVTAPQVVRVAPEDPTFLQCDSGEQVASAVSAAREYAGRGLFVGVVVPHSLRGELTTTLTSAGMVWGDAAEGQLSTSINVLSAEQAKGLEFDAVVIIEPAEVAAESSSGLRLLYVALTRSTRFLTIAHVGPVLPIHNGVSGNATGAGVEVPEALVSEPAMMPRTDRRQQARRPDRQGELFGVAPVLLEQGDAPQVEDRHGQPSSRATAGISKVARAVARSLADEIRESVTKPKYQEVLEALRQELERGETSDPV